MKNKELQESRMRGYFIEATKAIIKGEGVRGVSVRNVAREAGYSYTTMYSYFKDVNELVFHCVKDFQGEIQAFVTKQVKRKKETEKNLQAGILAYAKYFISYPGIFELFYLEGIGDLGHRKATAKLIAESMDQIIEKDLDAYQKKENLSSGEIHILKDKLRYITIGALLFYLNSRKIYGYKEFMEMLSNQVEDALI